MKSKILLLHQETNLLLILKLIITNILKDLQVSLKTNVISIKSSNHKVLSTNLSTDAKLTTNAYLSQVTFLKLISLHYH
jgi:hypothetical protein